MTKSEISFELATMLHKMGESKAPNSQQQIKTQRKIHNFFIFVRHIHSCMDCRWCIFIYYVQSPNVCLFFILFRTVCVHCEMHLAEASFAQYFMEHQVVEIEVCPSRWRDRHRARVNFDLFSCNKYIFATEKRTRVETCKTKENEFNIHAHRRRLVLAATRHTSYHQSPLLRCPRPGRRRRLRHCVHQTSSRISDKWKNGQCKWLR